MVVSSVFVYASSIGSNPAFLIRTVELATRLLYGYSRVTDVPVPVAIATGTCHGVGIQSNIATVLFA